MSRRDKRDEQWENRMTEAASFVEAASDARTRGDRGQAEHWEYMSNWALNDAAQIREGKKTY